MNSLIYLLVVLGVAHGASLPHRPPKCALVMCTMNVQICPDGTRAPVPLGGCCPSLSACKKVQLTNARSNPLSSIGSLLSGSNLLQTLTGATHGTDLGTVLSILNLLNNVHQLSNDIHQIPTVINQTIAAIINGTGQASQVVLQQLLSLAGASKPTSRNLLGSLGSALGQNTNLLSSISHLLPQGTSIATVLSLLNLLNNAHQLSNDIHQIPILINETLANIVNGGNQATQVVLQQLLALVGAANPSSRNLLGSLGSALGQNTNLLSSITHLLPQGTSITTILSLLNLLNNVHQLSNDIHQIPIVINQTLANIVNGTGQATQVILQQLLSLVGASKPTNRNLLGSLSGALGQNTNLLSTISHLLPQGTSISTVLSLLNLLGNINALNADLHQIPVVLQETIENILNGVQQLIPPTIQPL